MTISADNIAQHLLALGYSAKAGTINDKQTGQPQSVVFVNGLGSINAYLNLSDDPAKFGLRVFGNLQEGYAPVVFDENGDVVRETVIQNGQTVIRAKRGEPLNAEALKRKNNEISLAARKEISSAVLAAYMLELGGGDFEKLRDGFRLQKWERGEHKHTAEAGEPFESGDVATAFTTAAPAPTEEPSTRRKVKRSTDRAPGM